MIHKQTQSNRRTSVQAMVQYNNTGFHRHTLSDIGLDGAFVQMGNVRVLRRHAPVKVVFVHQHNGANSTHLINARVCDVEESGARLVFSDLDLPAHNALLKLEQNC
ncbi:MAG: PilZ domain-containing protein [Acidiferrobacterales bacterium]